MVDHEKFEQILKHFTSEVMERALGLGDRYTAMDRVPSPKNCNNAMMGSLIPVSIVDVMNKKAQKGENVEDEEPDENQDWVFSNDSYHIDIFIKKSSDGIKFDLNLEYWTSPDVDSKFKLPPYSLRGDENSPLSYRDNQLEWDEDKFHLPLPENNGHLIKKTYPDISPNDVINEESFKISSIIFDDQYGKIQRILIKANGDDPLFYPILKIHFHNINDVVIRKISRERLNEKSGERYEDFASVWFRSSRCQIIPFPKNCKLNDLINDVFDSIDPYNLNEEITPYLYITPISVFIEKDTKAKEIGELSLSKLYQNPSLGSTEILEFLRDNDREDLVEVFDKSLKFLIKNNNANEALKAVNLTYYNYFRYEVRKKSGIDIDPKWRLFQWTYLIIAFAQILQNSDLSHQFDFIGVRTGGGKTEAYVALTLALGFYSVFDGKTPEAITLIRFPRRTLVIDQYIRVLSLVSWANLILKFYHKSSTKLDFLHKNAFKDPSWNFSGGLMLGNESSSEISYSPATIDELYPRSDSKNKKIERIGTYGVKGPFGPGDNIRKNASETFEEDSGNCNIRWGEMNLIQAVNEFKNGIDLITQSAKESFPLKSCPLCGQEIHGEFDYDQIRPVYKCLNSHTVEIPGATDTTSIDDEIELFLYRTDEELARYRPTVVLGTLDKLPHIVINARDVIQESILGCFNEKGMKCHKHGFYRGDYKGRCAWNYSRGLYGGKFRLNCGDQEHEKGKSFKLIVHDEIHMFDDIVGGLSAPYERIFLKKLGKFAKVLGMSATLQNVADVSEKLFNRRKKFLYPPSFLFKEENILRRIHIGGLVSIPREKRQFKAMHLYIFQVLLTWINSPAQLLLKLQNPETNFKHPFLLLKDPHLKQKEIPEYLDLLARWVGYVTTKPTGEILFRDFDRGLECHSTNFQETDKDLLTIDYRESYYPFFGYISGDYPFDELSKELEKFKDSISDSDKRIPRALLTTNIFSVGVDISMLSTILFHKRPNSIAEYVQSSSRVGRSTPGLSIVSFTPAELRAADLFSTFYRDMKNRYELIEPSYFNPHAIGILRETILPILRLIMHLNIDGLTKDTAFIDKTLQKLIFNVYFGHLTKEQIEINGVEDLNNKELFKDHLSEYSVDSITHFLEVYESEYNKYAKDFNSRYEFITSPRKKSDKEIFEKIWDEIQKRHLNKPIPTPKIVNVRSVGDQIDVIGQGIWEYQNRG